MRFRSLLMFVGLLFPLVLQAQDCPKEDSKGPLVESAPRILAGKVIYHGEIRQWFELVLDTSTCGQNSVQLLKGAGALEGEEANAHSIEVFRGCHVVVDGPLRIAGTGYYSADIYQDVNKIDLDRDCLKQSPLPDYSKATPDSSVRSYRVQMKLDYGARAGQIFISAHSGKHLLTPWQAYASYFLTGSYAFYGNCADGYDMSRLRGTAEAKPWQMDNQAMMDPESAATKQIRWVTMEFTCRKEPRTVSKRSNQ